MPGTDVLLATLISVIWGINFVIAKAGLEQLPPILLVCIRFCLVSIVLVPFVKRPTGHWRGILWLAVTLGLLHFSFIFTGLAAVDAAVAAITVQSQVAFAAILAAVVFKDPPGWRRLTGMAVSVAGVAVLVGAPTGSSETWAIVFIIIAALLFAVANIQMTKMNALDGLSMNAWVAVFAAPMLAMGGGKSGLHGNTVPGNARRGRPQGKCHRKQTARLGRVRVKGCGKSAPRRRQRGGRANPTGSKTE